MEYLDTFEGVQKSCFPFINCGSAKGGEAFLIREGRVNILLDTGFGFCGEKTANNVKQSLNGESLHFILLSHSHYDHIMGLPHILNQFPNAQVMASEHCTNIMSKDTAKKAMFKMDAAAAEYNEAKPGNDLTNMFRVDKILQDNEEITIGDHKVKAMLQPGHTKCCMGFYFPKEKMILNSETIGSYVGNLQSLPSCLVGTQMTLDSIDRVMSLDLNEMFVAHSGMLYGGNIKTYLENAKKTTILCKNLITDAILRGAPEDEIINLAFETFYPHEHSEYYPKHAFIVNTKAQIKLFAKEAESTADSTTQV